MLAIKEMISCGLRQHCTGGIVDVDLETLMPYQQVGIMETKFNINSVSQERKMRIRFPIGLVSSSDTATIALASSSFAPADKMLAAMFSSENSYVDLTLSFQTYLRIYCKGSRCSRKNNLYEFLK